MEEATVNSKAMLTLMCQLGETPLIWCLDVAENFEQAFYHFEYVEVAYVLTLLTSEGVCPKEVDLKCARAFVSFLKVFYDTTLSFFGSLHVKAKNFLKMLVKMHNDDPMIQKMTNNMQLKFNKY